MPTGESRGNILATFIPRYLARLLETAGPGDLADKPFPKGAGLLFCDISGFTPLSEALGRHGKAGTEELTVHLNAYFQALLDVVEGWGGDTVKFGGDAVTVLFEKGEGEELSGALRRACACGLDILCTLGASRQAKTPWGIFDLRLKIGASAGPVLAGVLGEPDLQMEHVLAGSALDRMAEAEHHASPGDLVVDAALPFAAGAGLVLEPAGEGFARVKGLAGDCGRPRRGGMPRPAAERVRPFLLPSVYGQVEAGSEALLSEHRPVTTVFVSFAGLDYEDPGSLHRLEAYFRRVAALLRGYGGSFNRMDMGDKGSKFLCFFGAPESYENNEERAVAFALALRGLEEEIPWLGRQRMGVSAGTAYCGLMGSAERREYTVMGDAVNVAARLMGAAGEDGILATEAVREATRARVRYGPFRSLALKGKSKPIRVSSPLHPLRRQRARTAQARVMMVGRQAELSVLRRARTRVGKGPVPFFVLVGEAGIGKTTLLENFLIESGSLGCTTALGAAQSVGAAPLQCWSEVFKALLGGERGEREGIETRWRALLPNELDFLGLGLRFLGFSTTLGPAAENLEPRERQEKTTSLLAQTLRALAAESPVIVALDGLNYADAGTRELLAAMLPLLRGAKVLFMGASRPGEILPGSPHELPLGGIAPEEARQLTCAFLDAGRVSDAMVEFVEDRTGGNPLFILELLRNLKDRGALSKDREGRVLFHPSKAGDIPRSVEGLLLARIDRLPLVSRNVLKVAACLGLSFELELLQSIFLPRMEKELLKEHLSALGELGLSPHAGPEPDTYAFAHATVRETAYGAVLLANRRSIHRSAAESLESQGDRAEPSLLAFHFGQAEIWDRAFQCGLQAGYLSVERFAFKEAAALFDQVESWSRMAEVRIPGTDQVRMADSYLQAGFPQKTAEILDRVLSQDPGEVVRFSALEAGLKLMESQHRHAECIARAEELTAIALPLGRTDQAARASRYKVSSLFRLGRLDEALEEIARTREMLGGETEDEEMANFLVLQAAILSQRGEFPQAAELSAKASVWAKAHSNFPLEIRALILESNAARALQDLERSLERAKRAYELAVRVGARFNLLGGAATCANTLNMLGKHKEAGHLLEENLSLALQGDFPYASCNYLNEMGVTRYYQGRFRDAVRFYRASLRMATKIGNVQQMGPAEYNVADAMKAMRAFLPAEKQYRRAIRRFRESQNAPWVVTSARDALEMLGEAGEKQRYDTLVRFIKGEISKWNRPDLLGEIFQE